MKKQDQTAIAKLVAHNQGPVALSQALGEVIPYQEIQRWVRRGWASPMHMFKLEPFMPRGMKVRDLDRDRVISRGEA